MTNPPIHGRLDRGRDPALHYLEWPGSGPTIVLLHGLASSIWIWGDVGPRLAPRCRVVALDQRGHGASDKPNAGYDFDTLSADLLAFLDHLGADRPIVVGHSWGGNVALAFAATHPDRVAGEVWVDGGFLHLRGRPDATWESTERDLAPPQLAGLARDELIAMAQEWDYGRIWNENTERSLLGCFAIDEAGRIRPNLSLENHLRILRALWDQDPAELYPRVRVPVLILPARRTDPGVDRGFQAMRERAVARALESLPRAEVRWFEETLHDIPLHRPAELAEVITAFADRVSAL